MQAWREARVRWHDAQVHDRLLVLAGQHGRYAWLAARYREIARRDDPLARERLALVQRSVELTLAVAMMKDRDAGDEPTPHAATRRLLVVMLVVLALGMLLTKLLAGSA